MFDCERIMSFTKKNSCSQEHHDLSAEPWANVSLDRSRLREALAARDNALADALQKMGHYSESRWWRLIRRIQAQITARPWLYHSLRTAAEAFQTWRGPQARPADVKLLLSSPLFDANWYAAHNPGAPVAPAAAAAHYLAQRTSRAQSNPGPDFDTAWYRQQNPDIGAENALVHYLRIGRYRLRSPNAAAQQAAEDARLKALGLNLPPPRPRIAIGFATGASCKLPERAVGSARIAMAKAGLVDHALLWPGTAEDAPSGVRALDLSTEFHTGFAAHNRMLRRASDIGATLYLAADPAGFFAPDCLESILRMSAAVADKALIAATDFPAEHPRLIDPQTFDSAWAGGGCVLLPVASTLQLGGFEEALTHLSWIDLSWRMRQAGLRVMTCPNALYFNTLSQPGSSDWLSAEYLMDGFRLAQLWHATHATEVIGAEIRRHGVVHTDDMMDSLGRDPAYADWSHGFGFAPLRW
jgi:hypothetical protein